MMKRNLIKRLPDDSCIYIFRVDIDGEPQFGELCFPRCEMKYERDKVARIVRSAKTSFRRTVRAVWFRVTHQLGSPESAGATRH